MITIIDSGIANVASVLAAFSRIGATARATTDWQAVQSASALVLPGVGAFADGMESLRSHGLVAPIRDAAARGIPILGICLGMQLFADASEEFGEHEGLGLIPGRVVRLDATQPAERVPNIGWCDVRVAHPSRIFEGVGVGASFYFVHSYHLACSSSTDSVATIAFGAVDVTIAVEKASVFGVQFHPEKSQDAGLAVLDNYARLASSEVAR